MFGCLGVWVFVLRVVCVLFVLRVSAQSPGQRRRMLAGFAYCVNVQVCVRAINKLSQLTSRRQEGASRRRSSPCCSAGSQIRHPRRLRVGAGERVGVMHGCNQLVTAVSRSKMQSHAHKLQHAVRDQLTGRRVVALLVGLGIISRDGALALYICAYV